LIVGESVKVRLRLALTTLGDAFWLLPGGMVVGGILLGVGLVAVDRSGVVPHWLIESPWLYNGGGTGARTLLGDAERSISTPADLEDSRSRHRRFARVRAQGASGLLHGDRRS